jgi:CubicO group peptidase (beta-lactamase class C family)
MSSGLIVDAQEWRDRLDTMITAHGVPGAVVGVLADGQITEIPAGVLGVRTKVPVTADSIFQLGSITKVFTATLVMQLVDEGILGLETPVAEVLPGFRVANADVGRAVTIRHLLTHTSGIDGDIFTDTGRGADCLARYVEQLETAEQVHPLGGGFSYCNTGFIILGRVVEWIVGCSWDEVVRDRLVTPLQLTATVTLPEEALLHRAAIGHFTAAHGQPSPTREWGFPRSLGPAGGVISSVHDLLVFARAYLEGGQTRNGQALVSPASVRAMTDSQVELPDLATPIDSWGLGWFRCGWREHRLFGHDGGAIGQRAYLRILPERNFAVAVLSNGGDHGALAGDVLGAAFEEIAGIPRPDPVVPPAQPPPVDHSEVVGTYRRSGWITEVVERDGQLILRSTETDGQSDLEPEATQEYQLVAVKPGLFVMSLAGSTAWQPVKFDSLDDGRRYVSYQRRISPMVGTGPRAGS